ncbi:MAG TPA: DUF4410 domain-containing protein [Verrucomicrobiae bacterium]
MNTRVVLTGIAILLTLTVGCASSRSTRAKPLAAIEGQNVNLSRYDRAVIQPFDFPQRTLDERNAGQALANSIERRLESDFGRLFNEVRQGNPTGAPDEVIVTGRITEYRPGNRAARVFIPWGPRAELRGDVVVKDSATGEQLMVAPFDKLWGFAGGMGVAKDIDDLLEETAAAAANTIARARGWTPPQSASRD